MNTEILIYNPFSTILSSEQFCSAPSWWVNVKVIQKLQCPTFKLEDSYYRQLEHLHKNGDEIHISE